MTRTRTAMNAKISISVICFEAIIYLSLYNLLECSLKNASYKFMFDFQTEVIDGTINFADKFSLPIHSNQGIKLVVFLRVTN